MGLELFQTDDILTQKTGFSYSDDDSNLGISLMSYLQKNCY
jgi:hypothetical protein